MCGVGKYAPAKITTRRILWRDFLAPVAPKVYAAVSSLRREGYTECGRDSTGTVHYI